MPTEWGGGKPKPHPRLCPVCGAVMKRKRIPWLFWCKRCRYNK